MNILSLLFRLSAVFFIHSRKTFFRGRFSRNSRENRKRLSLEFQGNPGIASILKPIILGIFLAFEIQQIPIKITMTVARIFEIFRLITILQTFPFFSHNLTLATTITGNMILFTFRTHLIVHDFSLSLKWITPIMILFARDLTVFTQRIRVIIPGLAFRRFIVFRAVVKRPKFL